MSSPRTDCSLLDSPSLESTYRECRGVRLHAVTGGDPDGPLVVLLHGFPDFWYGWREQLDALVEAGYRVVAPDGRGHNLSDAPSGVEAYRTVELVADVRALIRSEGRSSAHVVGHDFGGLVAWELALRTPEMVDRLGIVNAPHPTVYRRFLRSDPRQMARSLYVAAAQVPGLPERLLGANDAAGLVRVLTDSSAAGTFDEETIRRYRAAWAHNGPGPMVNWYRGARRSAPPPRETVTQPTLICWGEDDPALVPDLATESIERCANGRLERFPEGSHWVHLEQAAVTDHLLDHLAG